MSYFSHVTVDEVQSEVTTLRSEKQLDSFGRDKVSMPGYRFDAQMTYNLDTTFAYDTLVNGGASSVAHDATRRCAVLTVGTGALDYAILQSHYYPPYTPGRGQETSLTVRIGDAITGLVKQAGYNDADNGYYLEQSSGTLYMVERSSVTGSSNVNKIPQSAWTYDGVVDAFNGSGSSGINLDITKTQILVIDGQALYVGRVRMGFNIDGEVHWAHEFNHANILPNPYVQSFSLPVRYAIYNTAISAGGTMDAICSTVISEGGEKLHDIPGIPATANNGVTAVSLAGGRRPVLSVRNKTSFNSITNRVVALVQDMSFRIANNDALIEIVYNGIISGTSWSSVDAESTMEYDVSGSTIYGGTPILSLYLSAAAGSKDVQSKENLLSKVVMALAANGTTPDTLSVVGTTFAGGTAASLAATINMKELRL